MLRKLPSISGPAILAIGLVLWTFLVGFSLITQRQLLDRTAEALARIDAVANLKKDMAIRKWAADVGGVFVKEDKAPNINKLSEQERVVARNSRSESFTLVSLTPIHILLGIQDVSNKEFGNRERLTSLQLHNSANAPDDWESSALKSLQGGADMVTEAVPRRGGHGLLRVMIPMRMDKECLECHRDTLVPVGGLRGGATIALDLNTYRSVQEPTWRAIRYWHLGIWVLGVVTLTGLWSFARRRAVEQARQDEERRQNEMAFAAMAEGAIITDAAGRILWVNDAFCHIYGYEREEVIGHNPRILKSGYHDATFYQDFWEQLSTEGRWRGELWNRRKTGEVFPEEISVRALRGSDGRIERFISIFSDITERKHNEKELQEYREQLEDLVFQRTEELTVARDDAEAANRAKSIFVANMSHELRTPLNAIIGFSELMDRDVTLSPAQRKNLAIIRSSGTHLLTLISDILEFSKLESAKTQLVCEDLNLDNLLREVVEMMRVRTEQAGLLLRLMARDLPTTVILDAVKLRQVLLNLLSNAVKFTHSGEVILRVVAVPTGDGKVALNLAVRDTGIGIAPQDVERIFQPFEQVDARPGAGGTGLGLAISRQYVQMMGGDLRVDSLPGKGSEFHFSLIVTPGTGHTPETHWGTVTGLRAEDRGRRILVVDDMPEARLLVRELLQPMGFLVEEAATAAALEYQQRIFDPDLIFLDWRLPDLDGLDAVRRIRVRFGTSRPKIVILSANVLKTSLNEALAAGADDFIGKPFIHSDLFARIEQHLGLTFERHRDTCEHILALPTVMAPISLTSLSASCRNELLTAALALNADQITEVLINVKAENPELAAILQPLVEAMDFRRLWDIIGLSLAEKKN